MKQHMLGKKISWKGREAFALGNELVGLVALTGGGHVAEFRFEKSSGHPSVSPLWIPPWKTIEPYHYRPEVHAARFGSLTEGKLLSGIVGHNICLDYFGPPSPEEAEQGLSQHGEAPSLRWRKTSLRVTPREASLALSVKLPVAGLRFDRQIKLSRGESVAYFVETVRNERKADHFFHWTQHVTLGPPFLTPRETRVGIPATRGKTFPHDYNEGKNLMALSKEFQWPLAPARAGGTVDLTRPLSKPGRGFVVAVLLDPRREVGYVAALNTRLRLLVGYCFSRKDFPWVAIWEENRAIQAVPWSGQCQTRGLEFGSTPIPVMRREAFALGTLFKTPAFAQVPAKGRKSVRYVAFLATTPSDFYEVSDIRLARKEILIYGTRHRDPVCLPASGLADFGRT